MLLRRAHIRGYRCFDDVVLDVDALTILLGSNSAGKSSLLKALQFFFDGEPLTAEDVFADSEDSKVSVELTFAELNQADRDTFGPYAAGDQMILTQTWEDGNVKLTGRALRAPIFDDIRKLTGVARRTAFNELVASRDDLGLEKITRVDEADTAMVTWEMGHPEECDRREDDAGSFFGYGSVGRDRLAQRFKFVFVPGLRDASEEATERKGSILSRLLSAIAEQRTSADAALNDLLTTTREAYAKVVAESHGPTLEGLADSLQEHMRRYVPRAQVELEAVESELLIRAPGIVLRGGEERHITDLGRQGHGFQRTFVIAALEYLAQVSAADADPEGETPTLFLAIEEPELYQHPPRARHFANTLRSLATGDGAVQVAYATHSPYFVDAADFASVGVCRRDPTDEMKAPIGTVVRADPDEVAKRIPESYRDRVGAYLSRTLSGRFRESFFARAVLLVEGETDAAVFEQIARMQGGDLLSNGVVCADVSKSVLPVGLAILGSLKIPSYTVFDGDEHREDADVCEACGRGSDKDRRAQAIRENGVILAALGEPAAEFPGDRVEDSWASFAVDIEHFLADGAVGFADTAQEVASELGWKKKSAEVHIETLQRIGLEAVPQRLRTIVDRVMTLAG